MKKHISIILLIFSLGFANAQTIVKMSVPTQAKEPVNVVVLFDEQVPEGMPVVLGLMGYSVSGGIEPYTYQWVQNGTVVGTGDVVVITPKKGDQFSLKATDKNKCYSTTSFSMKVISRINAQNNEDKDFGVYPSLVKDNTIHVDLPKTEKTSEANIRIFSAKGEMLYQHFSTESFVINHPLPDGIYFVSVKTNEFHKVVKVIVKH